LLRFVFGPVRSRRLGLSLGVNNIPYKTCSYSCIYCQLGRTLNLTVGRGEFFDWRDIVGEVVEYFRGLGGGVDYITFVPDGEPLLDKSIGREIEWIKRETSTPIAVLTNASLLYLDEARSDLQEADLVSLKVDAVSEDVWRTVNRPHPTLKLERILEGVVEFARGFKGTIITETMLVRKFNDGGVELEKIAEFLRELSPRKAYIAIPVRPPAESFVLPPGASKLVEAHEIFKRRLGEDRVELLNLPEPPPPSAKGDPAAWLLSVTSVHPLKLEYAAGSLRHVVEDPEKLIAELERQGLIKIVEYSGARFIVRWFREQQKQ